MTLKKISSAALTAIAVCVALTALAEPTQAQDRLVEWSPHPLIKVAQSASDIRLANVNEAVEIVDIKVVDASIIVGRSFLAGDDWLRGLSFKMKNVSGRSIIGARLSFSLPETRVDNNGLGFSLEYGRGESTGIPSDEQKVVLPNEEFELRFNDRQYQRHREFVATRSKLKTFSKITIGTLFVKFDDESIWAGGCLRASAPANSCHAPKE
ncbi:MAG: hypothetical protein DMF69_08310 [Acidobacteria bacterium]|nr:MAG: hypothetical protein DMF69_08310 [Acidobacteriota bacterium]